MKRLPVSLILMAGVLVLLSGCVDKTIKGDVAIFTYELWVLLTMIVSGAVAIVVSGLLPRRSDGLYRLVRRIRLGLLIGGIISIFGATWMYFDKVTVSPTEITERTGFWGSTVHDVAIGDLARGELIKEESGSGTKRHRNNYLMFYFKNGSVDKFPLNNANVKAAFPDIVLALQKAGVALVDRTGER